MVLFYDIGPRFLSNIFHLANLIITTILTEKHNYTKYSIAILNIMTSSMTILSISIECHYSERLSLSLLCRVSFGRVSWHLLNARKYAGSNLSPKNFSKMCYNFVPRLHHFYSEPNQTRRSLNSSWYQSHEPFLVTTDAPDRLASASPWLA